MKNFTQEEAKVIYNDAKKKGLNPDKVMSELVLKGATFDGIDMNQAKQYAQSQVPQTTKPGIKEKVSEAGGDILGIGKDIIKSSSKRAENIQEAQDAMARGEQGFLRTTGQTFGQLLGGGADAITAAGKSAVNLVLSDKSEKVVTDVIGKFGAKVMANPQVQNIINEYNALPEEKQRDIDAVGGVIDLVSNFVGGGAVSKGADVVGTGVKTIKKATGEVLETGIDTTITGGKQAVTKLKENVISSLSPDIDPAFKNIISKTSTQKFDDFVRVAEEASNDLTKPSVYEKVAQNMTDATKQINDQVKSLTQQKNTIINKAKVGLNDFTKETGQTILEINKKLKDNSLANSFIDKLKQVKTKIDADKTIDELQNILYKGNKDMTIPVGSTEDKILKGLLGEYNSKLKSSLPKSYSKINTDISNRIKALNVLNRALGETVDGVATRGAGLVKQFFSPAGTKTKQLFDYIKKTTGVDLAEDAVLAKYVGEAFGDTKIKSLLEGVPTTKAGIIDTAADFILDKTGVSGAFKEAKQKGMLEKARKLTK